MFPVSICLHAAIAAIAAARVRVVAVSSFYRTRPFGPSQPDYVNLVLKVNTVLGARGLLHEMQGVEAAFGRAREVKWGPRTLDIDLISMPAGRSGPDPFCRMAKCTAAALFSILCVKSHQGGGILSRARRFASSLADCRPAERAGITRLV